MRAASNVTAAAMHSRCSTNSASTFYPLPQPVLASPREQLSGGSTVLQELMAHDNSTFVAAYVGFEYALANVTMIAGTNSGLVFWMPENSYVRVCSAARSLTAQCDTDASGKV